MGVAVFVVGLGDDFVNLVAFHTHLVVKGPFQRRVIEVIGDIPDGFHHLVLDTVVMAVNAGDAGFFMRMCQQIFLVIAVHVWLHHMAG